MAFSLILGGCSSTKRVPEGERLLVGNEIKSRNKVVSKEELSSIIKQKPNQKVLGLRFYLSMYNLADPAKIEDNRARKDAERDRRNEKRLAKGRSAKPYKRTTGQWLREVVGEAPVLVDTMLTRRSAEQMELYLHKEGFFNAQVRDSITNARPSGRPYHKPKSRVIYTVRTGKPYTLCEITFRTDDPAIEHYVQERWSKSLLRTGDRFDADKLEEERTRITNSLKDLGYLYFTRDMVTFDADTTVGNKEVDLVLKLQRVASGRDRGLKGTREGTYHFLEDVVVDTRRRATVNAGLPPDTVVHKNVTFLYKGRMDYRPEALMGAIFLKPGDRYDQTNNDRTYRRLTGLRVFDRVDITYDSTNTAAKDLVHARIGLMPGKIQTMSIDGYGTNRGGALGTQLSLSYKHKNLFRTMGSIRAAITFGFEAQQAITGGSSGSDATTGSIASSGLFNTLEIGPELTVSFPQFLLPVKREKFSRSAAPRSVFNVLYSYQQRPDYSRTLARFGFGYEWSDGPTKTWAAYPLNVNVIKIPRISDAFSDYLREANDPVLTDSYTDHLIVGGRLQYTYNTQARGRSGPNDVYYRFTFEPSGNLLYALDRAVDAPMSADTSGNTFFTLLGVRYAHFLKFDNDIRFYRHIHERSDLVFRVAAGIGIPLTNLGVLPFETSFFVGGANGLRAWRARTVGPGSYSAPLVAFDRTGEIRLEANAEYRFGLIGYLEGALFVDVGNIWYLQEDPARPGSGISSDLLEELAIGTGLGFRLNFDFFLVRFDMGLQTRDPALPVGERWLFQPKDDYEALITEYYQAPFVYKPLVNFNLGIGYPF